MSDTKGKRPEVKKILSNIFYAFMAQAVSLLLSVIMSLFVPKILGIEQFGYWQLFLFYSSYVGFFHFGLNDGIYLRYGGSHYEDLDYSIIGSQFWASMITQTTIAALISVFSIIFIKDSSRQFVFIMTAISLILVNTAGFLGYVFQMTNKTKLFSLSVLVDKVFFVIAIIVLYCTKTRYFELFVAFYLVSKLLSLFYCLYKAKSVVFARRSGLKIIFEEIGINVSIGINLMISNMSSMLVLGCGRLVIDRVWGIEAFGKFSFSLSLTNFFLLFIGQISMVLFPALKQTDQKHLNKIFMLGRNSLGIILMGIFLAYMPIQYALNLWLPQYNESLKYLILLLPICTFDGKMNIICSTYLKVLRKEKALLVINLISLLISVVFSIIGGYVIHDIYAILIFTMISIAIRSVIAEIYLSRLMDVSIYLDILYECILVAIFVTITWNYGIMYGFVIYAIAYTAYLIYKRNIIIKIFRSIKSIY